MKILTEPEIARSKSLLHEQLGRIARTDLQSWLDTENKNNGEDYSLLMGEAITLSGEVLNIASEQKIGDRADEIELR